MEPSRSKCAGAYTPLANDARAAYHFSFSLWAMASEATRRTRLKPLRAHTRGHGCCVPWHRLLALLLWRHSFLFWSRARLCASSTALGKLSLRRHGRAAAPARARCVAWLVPSTPCSHDSAAALCTRKRDRALAQRGARSSGCARANADGRRTPASSAGAASRQPVLLAPGRASFAALNTSSYSAGCWRADLVFAAAPFAQRALVSGIAERR